MLDDNAIKGALFLGACAVGGIAYALFLHWAVG
jgi:hypothetical protein